MMIIMKERKEEKEEKLNLDGHSKMEACASVCTLNIESQILHFFG
jgi:hypothetical protein